MSTEVKSNATISDEVAEVSSTATANIKEEKSMKSNTTISNKVADVAVATERKDDKNMGTEVKSNTTIIGDVADASSTKQNDQIRAVENKGEVDIKKLSMREVINKMHEIRETLQNGEPYRLSKKIKNLRIELLALQNLKDEFMTTHQVLVSKKRGTDVLYRDVYKKSEIEVKKRVLQRQSESVLTFEVVNIDRPEVMFEAFNDITKIYGKSNILDRNTLMLNYDSEGILFARAVVNNNAKQYMLGISNWNGEIIHWINSNLKVSEIVKQSNKLNNALINDACCKLDKKQINNISNTLYDFNKRTMNNELVFDINMAMSNTYGDMEEGILTYVIQNYDQEDVICLDRKKGEIIFGIWGRRMKDVLREEGFDIAESEFVKQAIQSGLILQEKKIDKNGNVRTRKNTQVSPCICDRHKVKKDRVLKININKLNVDVERLLEQKKINKTD